MSSNPPEYPFHKYHLRITNFLSGIAVITLLFMPIAAESKWMLVIWKISLFGVSIYYWKKRQVSYWAVTLPFVLGLITFARILGEFFIADQLLYILSVLSGFILCTIFFINHLCVWNIIYKEKSFDLLKKFIVLYSVLLLIRLGWDCYALSMRHVCQYTVYMESFGSLLIKQKNWLPFLGVLFVAVLPLISVAFFRRNSENNTYGWALGFMLPVLMATIAGEICLKMVWHKYGIPM